MMQGEIVSETSATSPRIHQYNIPRKEIIANRNSIHEDSPENLRKHLLLKLMGNKKGGGGLIPFLGLCGEWTRKFTQPNHFKDTEFYRKPTRN
jgi:hypothetical protein